MMKIIEKYAEKKCHRKEIKFREFGDRFFHLKTGEKHY